MKVVRVLVTNRKVYFRNLSPKTEKKLKRFWSYSVPNFKYMRGWPGWDGRIQMLKYKKLSAGLFWATYKECEKECKVRFKIKTDMYWPDVKCKNVIESKGKYAFQGECSDKMLRMSPFGGGLVLNATATGKTRTAALLISRLAGTICFVVDQLDLLFQAKRELQEALGEKVGFVGMSKFRPRRVTVATIQSLHKHREKPEYKKWTDDLEILFIDEIHVQMGRRNFDVVTDIEPLAVYGLTATLQLKRKPIRMRAWALAGPVIYEYPLKRGMEEKVLSKGIVIRLKYQNPIAQARGVPRSKAGRWQRFYKVLISENNDRNVLLKRLAKFADKKGKYTILLVERVRHLEDLSWLLREVPHRLAYGKREVAERQRAQKAFEKGKIRLIIANKVFKKGVNIKRVDVIIDGAGLKSKDDCVQKFGRGIRLHPDKSGLLYFDVSDVEPVSSRRKENSFAQAAGSRYRAFKKAGITVKDFTWGKDGETSELFAMAQKALEKELRK